MARVTIFHTLNNYFLWAQYSIILNYGVFGLINLYLNTLQVTLEWNSMSDGKKSSSSDMLLSCLHLMRGIFSSNNPGAYSVTLHGVSTETIQQNYCIQNIIQNLNYKSTMVPVNFILQELLIIRMMSEYRHSRSPQWLPSTVDYLQYISVQISYMLLGRFDVDNPRNNRNNNIDCLSLIF